MRLFLCIRSSNAEKFTVVGCYDHNLNTDRKRRLLNFRKGTQVPKEGILVGLFSASNQNGDQHYDAGLLCSIHYTNLISFRDKFSMIYFVK